MARAVKIGRQRGFSLLAYGLIALAVLAALSGIAWKINRAGYNEAVAELQPKLDACQGQVAALGQQIAAQNAAVAALKIASDEKVKKAQDGLKAASKESQSARSEAERLRALARTPASPSDCPAGLAVQEVRRGLDK